MRSESRRLSFHGAGGTLFGLYIVSALLSVVTLGIYSFWGRTKVRQYLWSQTEFAGDRFTYHGTGKELLVGWLKVMGVFFVMYVVMMGLQIALGQSTAVLLVPVVFWLVIMALIPVAILGARRYRLSRTSWRGVRFSLRGDTGEFVRLWLGGVLLSCITLGFYSPFFQTNVRRFLTRNARFGNRGFQFDGEGNDLFGPYVRAFFLSIITLGIYGFWWRAERERYFWSHTKFGGARLRSTMTGGGLFGLMVTNALLLVFTLGIAGAWVVVRTRRYLMECVNVDGALDLDAIVQDRALASATAEGLADVLDVGGLDVGI